VFNTMFGYNPSHLVGIALTGHVDAPHVVSKLVFHRCDCGCTCSAATTMNPARPVSG